MLFDGKLLKVILSLVLAASACLASWTASAGETLKIGGVGSSMGSMELLGAAFEDLHPGAKVMVLQSLGSGGGIMAVAKGAVDIAIAGRPLKEEERRLGLTATEFAKTPVVFAVKTGNALSGLSRADLIAMIKGDVTTWPDGRRARAVLRPVSDAETMIIKEAAPDVGLAIERAITTRRNDRIPDRAGCRGRHREDTRCLRNIYSQPHSIRKTSAEDPILRWHPPRPGKHRQRLVSVRHDLFHADQARTARGGA